MDRMRGGRAARRKTQPVFSGSFDSSETRFAGGSQSPNSPTMPFAQAPHTAPPNRRTGRQASMPRTQSLASSPTANAGKALRKRTRTFGADGAGDEDDEDESVKKGSHNLRKRPKIDYAAQDFEDEVPEIAMAAPRAITRKKSETLGDDMAGQRRRASREISVADSGRRKTPARRATEQGFNPYLPPSEDVVQDTIEVVGDSSDLHASDEVSDHESPEEPQIKQTSSPIQQRQNPFSVAQHEPTVTSLPSPIASTQASEKNPDIIHPQPVHANHVSIITEPEPPVKKDEPTIDYPPDNVSRKSEPLEAEDAPLKAAEDPPQEAAEAPLEPARPVYAWSHLTPYMPGEVVLHPEPSALGGADEDEDAEDYVEEEEPQENGVSFKSIDDEDASRAATSTPQTPRRGTPAPSNGITGNNTPLLLSDKIAALTKASAPHRRKQYKFPKLRDPADFAEYLSNHKDMPTEELWLLLAHANETLVAWQDEWQDCGRKVDDYENAKRRAQQDAEYEKKTADLDQFSRFESYLEKDFELRGYRAPVKEKEEGVHHQRWQDRVMAAAYGFEHDPHVSKIGNQDPIAQREGIMAGRQLRSQPQQTAKAAEAGEGGDGLVVVGKRTRNPPKLYEGLMQDDNRAGTPAEANGGATAAAIKPLPKRRGRPPLQRDGDETGPKKRGPRGRKSEVTAADTDADTPAPAQEAIAPPPARDGPKRRRGRQPKSSQTVDEAEEAHDEDEAALSDEASTKRARAARRRGKPDLSFLKRSNSHIETEEEESRPTTSSSNDTVSDAGSAYEFRQNKRVRTHKEDAEADDSAVLPPRKRPRINLKTSGRAQVPVSSSDEILANLARAPRPMTPLQATCIITFRHLGGDRWTATPDALVSRESSTNGMSLPASVRPSAVPSVVPSAPASTTSSAPPSQAPGDDDTKDYSTMTKSEKMSASMKKRWMNGSMQNAVNKRKATLAAKKAAAAAAAAASSTTAPTTPVPAQQPVAPAQPPRLHPFINMNGQQGRFS